MLGHEHIPDVPHYELGCSQRWCHYTLQHSQYQNTGRISSALWQYSAEGQDSPEYISVHRVEHFAEIHLGCQQPRAEVTQTVVEDTECQDAIYGRLLGCETRLLLALVS